MAQPHDAAGDVAELLRAIQREQRRQSLLLERIAEAQRRPAEASDIEAASALAPEWAAHFGARAMLAGEIVAEAQRALSSRAGLRTAVLAIVGGFDCHAGKRLGKALRRFVRLGPVNSCEFRRLGGSDRGGALWSLRVSEGAKTVKAASEGDRGADVGDDRAHSQEGFTQ